MYIHTLAGHTAIKELEQYFEVWVLTQNIDSFHTAAGSKNVIDIHGNIHQVKTVCMCVYTHAYMLPHTYQECD